MINEGSEVYRAQRTKEEQERRIHELALTMGRYGMLSDVEIRSMHDKEVIIWNNILNTLQRIERRLGGNKIDESDCNTLVTRVTELESTIASLRRVLSGDDDD